VTITIHQTVLSLSTICKNFFNLLLKFLTERNSFRDEGNSFHILLALYFTVLFP